MLISLFLSFSSLWVGMNTQTNTIQQLTLFRTSSNASQSLGANCMDLRDSNGCLNCFVRSTAFRWSSTHCNGIVLCFWHDVIYSSAISEILFTIQTVKEKQNTKQMYEKTKATKIPRPQKVDVSDCIASLEFGYWLVRKLRRLSKRRSQRGNVWLLITAKLWGKQFWNFIKPYLHNVMKVVELI